MATKRVKTYFPAISGLIFLGLVLTFGIVYDYHHILVKPAQSVHLWRQSDCLSMTLNYMQDNRPFLVPAIHHLGEDGSGQTISEFPLLYYLIGKIWKITGQAEWIYRSVVLMFFVIALVHFFRFFESYLKDSISAILFAGLLFTSPVLVYYANNFLMDMPAFSMALIGVVLFLRFHRSGTNRYFYFSMLAFALAGLLKISSLLSFMAIVCLIILELATRKPLNAKILLYRPFKHGIWLFAVFFLQVTWYRYAIQYNQNHNSGIFLTGLLPIWELNVMEIKSIWVEIKNHLRWDYYRPLSEWIFLSMGIFCLLFLKRTERVFIMLFLLSILGGVGFICGFYQALADHDYYTINLFIILPLLFLVFASVMKTVYSQILYSWTFRVILLVFLLHNVDFAHRRMNSRYDPAGWQNAYYTEHISILEKIHPYLAELGIDGHSLVLVPSDKSINISLYKMNRKGWTYYGLHQNAERMKQRIAQGAEYLIQWDRPNIDWKTKIPHEKIGQFQHVEIYRVFDP